ncbi:carboxypeptidase regulatory-like domain-containing protein [Anabaena azotica]|uniref:Carboxypeptidase regulatory-like domain-containing protein n=1 Tax=Anabaena azotica FACHB-119 TaxID=947527 RepID=A0ABR8CZ67_9NOST|nr:carboxypeptidase regulatory-like domain-containing protein [Anabaena azotica]MBD2500234.1 carboxypeptidase regulatory-like domain-containing protein [Anabaena azotica FACHB-119]
MFYQAYTPPPVTDIIQSEDGSCKRLVDANILQENRSINQTISKPNPPESLPTEFSGKVLDRSCNQIQANEAKADFQIANVDESSLKSGDNQVVVNRETAITQDNHSGDIQNSNNLANDAKNPITNVKDTVNNPIKNEQLTNKLTTQDSKTVVEKKPSEPSLKLDNILANGKTLLVSVISRGQEIGSLEILPEGNSLLIPLDDLAKIAGLEVTKNGDQTQIKTPLGIVNLVEADLKKVEGITYISETVLKEKLLTDIKLNTSDLALNVDFPWRRGAGESRAQAADLQPEVRPPSSGLSSLRQELNYSNNSGNSNWNTSTLLGGRLAGGSWRLRLDNNFVTNPQLTEYFYFRRSGRFLYQVGKQQLNINPVFSSLSLTGLQFGYTNLPETRFSTNYSASELLPRRSQPSQGFRGVVPPASFVQLRVGGAIFAQQQVGLSGEYDFPDVLLPTGRTNEIELWIFDRNNPNIPIEIRSVSLNSSDLLLPAGGNVQLAGLGVTGNWVQNNLLDDFSSTQEGKFTGFYQIRQGISNNLTLEAGVQLLPETTQAQAGFAWRLANPLILSANVGTSSGELGYRADLDFQLKNWRVIGVSESYPQRYFNYSGYSNTINNDRSNHSLDVSYKFSNDFTLGFVARSYKNQNDYTNYILPSFSLRAGRNLFFTGLPSYNGDYTFNASYQPTRNTRLLFNAFGNVYNSNLSYDFSQQFGLSFGTESGGDLPTRYTLTLNRNAQTLSGLSWRLGLGYRDGEIGPVIGASMRLIPGLFARIDYQGIPSRARNIFGNSNDERLTISLVSDLSFAGGRVSPAEYTSIGKDSGAIAGRVVVIGGRNGLDLSGATIRVYNKFGRDVGATEIDSQGNFFIGNLREGNYLVQIDPDGLPVELAVQKTSIVAEVASSAVTNLNFPVRLEYGMAGKITDASGQPLSGLELELIDAQGKRVATAVSDEFGLYRIDGIPVGKYTLRVPQQANITSNTNLPQLDVAISQDFIYGQDLKLPISASVKQIPDDSQTPNPEK